ncbi:hypothetical protein Z948_2820 [Sulfitobacter donghicola DSW-25 = KCTC 12864 = JCM 14565]|nr:hypothetical protein Z948_2820 [Sulfitobacter donghicola DSW-25 = KCTC 12864 = JCM 14565]
MAWLTGKPIPVCDVVSECDWRGPLGRRPASVVKITDFRPETLCEGALALRM